MGVLYDQFSTLPLLKVKEVVDLLSSIYGKKQNEQLLHNLGIIPLMNKYFKVLSKGERKKLGLYSCLFFEPKYLFLDEPTDGLDPEFREFFWQYIKNSEVTLLLTTHLWEEAIRVADKVMFIENGRILNTPQTYEILYKEIGLIGKIVLESKIDFENKDKYKHYFTEDRLLVYYKTEQEKKELLEYIQSKELFGYSVLPIDITDIYYCLKTSKR
ncbi:ATP-binding cassette domain-containing protein [Riemerella anatipestifer]|uniref:ATP-binding cassette domain-containing protein n=1 Tax=Riemerella anatipestifer TaxID=34085 RepID=UPI0021A2ECD8|nr:ATP-binding cassette domain-containing protein [Riemerella anatipestifer]UWS41899.1 ATP-binding cassette domain-containing protein [Riemerella anatipestifer]